MTITSTCWSVLRKLRHVAKRRLALSETSTQYFHTSLINCFYSSRVSYLGFFSGAGASRSRVVGASKCRFSQDFSGNVSRDPNVLRRPLNVQFVAAVDQEADEVPRGGGGVDVIL